MARTIALLASCLSATGKWLLPLADRAAVARAASRSHLATAYCLPGDILAAEYALAAGCDVRALDHGADVEEFGEAWIGIGFLEARTDLFAAEIAEQAEASLIFDVLSCTDEAPSKPVIGGQTAHELNSPPRQRTVVCDAGRGARQVLAVVGPVVLVVAETPPPPAYVSRHRRQQARQHPSLRRFLQSAPSDAERGWQPVRPRTRRTSATTDLSLDQRMDAAFGVNTSQSQSGEPIAADPTTCAEHLLRYLVHHGFWRRGGSGSELSPPVVSADTFASADTAASRSQQPRVSERMLVGTNAEPQVSPPLAAAISRRPRYPGESLARRRRQPRRRESSVQSTEDSRTARRPRAVGEPKRLLRGPRWSSGPATT